MFKVDRTELIQTLEIISETQGLEFEVKDDNSLPEGDYTGMQGSASEGVELDWAQGSGVVGQEFTREYVKDWLLLLQRFPLKGDYILSEEQSYFIMEHYS